MIKKQLFAFGLKAADPMLTRIYGSVKNNLLYGLSGTILEIGPGSGVNFKYYAKHSRIIAVEPNHHLHDFIKQAAAEHGLILELHGTRGESIDLPADSVDTAVSTLVLCSVTSPARVLSEIFRVLKPGGKFLFIEHVAAGGKTRLHRFQKFIKPIWKNIFDGCHPDRTTRFAIENAGFNHVHFDVFNLFVPIVSPHISGVAVK